MRRLYARRAYLVAVEAGQTVIMEGTGTHLRDEQIDEGIPYFYTVFVRDAQGEWQRQVKTNLRPHESPLAACRTGGVGL